MTDKPDGGPMFPLPMKWDPVAGKNVMDDWLPGASYRQWLVGQIVSGAHVEENPFPVARRAVLLADAIIEELGK